jgi:hypothetical protein
MSPLAPRPRHGCRSISLRRRRTGRRLRPSARALQGPPRRQPVEDDRHAPEAAGAGRTLQHVDLEVAAEQLGPDEVTPRARPRDARCRPAGIVCNGERHRNDLRSPARVGRENAVVSDQVLHRPRNQRGQPRDELLRCDLERDRDAAPRRLQREPPEPARATASLWDAGAPLASSVWSVCRRQSASIHAGSSGVARVQPRRRVRNPALLEHGRDPVRPSIVTRLFGTALDALTDGVATPEHASAADQPRTPTA